MGMGGDSILTNKGKKMLECDIKMDCLYWAISIRQL